MICAVEKCLDAHKLNFISPYGFGDTLVLCNFLDTLKEKYGDINLIVKQSHSFIPEIFGIKKFSIVNGVTLDNFREISEEFPKPEIGSPFIAHPNFSKGGEVCVDPFLRGEISFQVMYERFFDVKLKNDITIPSYNFEPSDTLKVIIKALNINLEKVALLAPEATSIKTLDGRFWLNIANDCIDRGLIPVSTVCDIQNLIPRSLYIPLSCRDMLSVVDRCAEVHSLRSGFCDLIALKKKKIYIYYPDSTVMKYALLKDVFQNTTAIEVCAK